MKLYLNHSCLEGASDTSVIELFREMVNLIRLVRIEHGQIHVFSGLWDMQLAYGTLRNFVQRLASSRTDWDQVQVVIESIMKSGPYYYDNGDHEELQIQPNIHVGTSMWKFLHICYFDWQELILSLKNEQILIHDTYHLSGISGELNITHLIGEKNLEQHIRQQQHFKDIDEVFCELEERFAQLIILDSARSSAKRHEFRGRYQEVFTGIKELVETELINLVDGLNDEIRKEAFRKATRGIEISSESKRTLENRRFRRQREFIIPIFGKQLFDWHVKIDGNHTRIHYYIDKVQRKVYIGHCGEHLGTSSYNS